MRLVWVVRRSGVLALRLRLESSQLRWGERTGLELERTSDLDGRDWLEVGGTKSIFDVVEPYYSHDLDAWVHEDR